MSPAPASVNEVADRVFYVLSTFDKIDTEKLALDCRFDKVVTSQVLFYYAILGSRFGQLGLRRNLPPAWKRIPARDYRWTNGPPSGKCFYRKLRISRKRWLVAQIWFLETESTWKVRSDCGHDYVIRWLLVDLWRHKSEILTWWRHNLMSHLIT